MKLQRQTLAVIAFTFVGLVVALYAASQVIVLGSFTEQEKLDAQQNVERVLSALADNLSALEGTTRDWSLWDDTFAYVQDQNDDYFKSNLSNDAPMTSNRLSLMLFINSAGETVFAKALDYRKGEAMPVPLSLGQYITAGSYLLTHPSTESSITGILSLPEGPMLVASEPILPSSGEGKAAGTLIFGRFLDTEEIQRLSKTTLSSLSAHRLDDPAMSSDFRDALAMLTEESPTLIRPLDSGTIAGYALLNDVFGKPALALRAGMPRGVFERGQATVGYYMLALGAGGLVFAFVTMLLLQRLVLSRLARLDAQVTSISASRDHSARVSASGSDELRSLADSINDMLAALERSLHEQKEGEERYRSVLEQASEGIFLVDVASRRFLEANHASQTLLGYTPEELLEMRLDDVALGYERDSETGRRVTTGKLRLTVERKYRRKDGTVLHAEISDTVISFGGREVLCIVMRDISDRKRAEAILRDLAMHDGLTGLYNRREMHRILKEEAERAIRDEQPMAIVLADIDHFKTINDSYGHQVGDDVLRWVARVFANIVQPVGKVARYGGEELVAIIPQVDAPEAADIAERLRDAIGSRPFAFQPDDGEEVLIPVTVSLGVAGMPDDGDTDDSLFFAADRALYEAKRQGRDRTVRFGSLRRAVGASG